MLPIRKIAGLFDRQARALEKDVEAVSPYTMVDPIRLRNLLSSISRVNRDGVEGDVVECGVCNGGSAALMAKHMGSSRHIWMYDSFQGMPETTERDGDEAKQWEGSCVGSVARVREALSALCIADETFTIIEGWFEDAFRDHPLPEKVALLHCDADWYDSVLLVLNTFYDRIPDGGIILLDDFGHWEGCREAYYDFCSEKGIKPLLERAGYSQAYWIKGRESNR